MSANTHPPVKIELSPTPDFVLALADVIRFIDKKRANANANAATLTTDEPRAERPPAPPKKQR